MIMLNWTGSSKFCLVYLVLLKAAVKDTRKLKVHSIPNEATALSTVASSAGANQPWKWSFLLS